MVEFVVKGGAIDQVTSELILLWRSVQDTLIPPSIPEKETLLG